MPNKSKRSGVVGEEDVFYNQVMVFNEDEDEDVDKKPEKVLGEEDEESLGDLSEEEDNNEDDKDDSDENY
jgi:hypothetical protein